MIVVFVWVKLSSSSKVQSQMASLVAVANAIYLASTDEVTTVPCFFEDQDTHPLLHQTQNY